MIALDGLQHKALNLRVAGRRTCVSLEGAIWDAFDQICAQLGSPRHALASRIEIRRGDYAGLTAAIRVFVLVYWRTASGALNAPPTLMVDEVLRSIFPAPQDRATAQVLEFKDRIAPHLTSERVRSVLRLSGQLGDASELGAAVRSLWKSVPPWTATEDAIAARALVEMVGVVRREPAA